MHSRPKHGIPDPRFFVWYFPPEIAKDARNFETARLCFICINQKPKDFDPPVEPRGCASNNEEAELSSVGAVSELGLSENCRA